MPSGRTGAPSGEMAGASRVVRRSSGGGKWTAPAVVGSVSAVAVAVAAPSTPLVSASASVAESGSASAV